MPLGKISKSQIAKGFEALEQIEDAIKNNKTSKLDELTSLFYTLIPHNFGRQRPPTISDNATLRKKMDMLIVTSCKLLLLLKLNLKRYLLFIYLSEDNTILFSQWDMIRRTRDCLGCESGALLT